MICGVWGVALTAAPLQADQVAERDVIAAVETWVRYVTADARPDAFVEAVEPHTVDGVTTAYIADLSGGGYCICGADTDLLPVYLYNPHAWYDPANPGCRVMLQGIDRRLDRLRRARAQQDPKLEDYQILLERRLDAWQDLIAGRIPPGGGGSDSRADPDYAVVPLKDHWHQGSPYNDQCPNLTPGEDERTVVGCVATSMTQVMNYWKWPDVGQGTGSWDWDYRWRSYPDMEPLAEDPGEYIEGRLFWFAGFLYADGYWDGSIYWIVRSRNEDNQPFVDALDALWDRMNQGTLPNEANFGATTYDWDIIKPEHTDPVDPGDVEVAKLSYHVGISVGMRWGLWSSASSLSVEAAMENNWRYHTDYIYSPSDFDTIVDEIRWFRPVLMGGGQEGVGGHQWVACGYNLNAAPEPQILFNMGWGGGSTNWASLDEVFPDDQMIHWRIAPNDGVYFVDNGPSGGSGSPTNPYLGLPWALSVVPDGTTLVMRAGSTHTHSGVLTIDRPLTLKGYDVIIDVQ
jgi:hypothetical protein